MTSTIYKGFILSYLPTSNTHPVHIFSSTVLKSKHCKTKLLYIYILFSMFVTSILLIQLFAAEIFIFSLDVNQSSLQLFIIALQRTKSKSYQYGWRRCNNAICMGKTFLPVCIIFWLTSWQLNYSLTEINYRIWFWTKVYNFPLISPRGSICYIYRSYWKPWAGEGDGQADHAPRKTNL